MTWLRQICPVIALLALIGCGEEPAGRSVDARRTGPTDGSAPVPQIAVPQIDLSRFESVAAEQIRAAQDNLRAATEAARPLAWAELGTLLHSFEMNDVALICYEQAESAMPDDYRWPYLAGCIHLAESRPLEARHSLDRAVRTMPVSKNVSLQRAAALSRLGNLALDDHELEQAAAFFRQAAEADPGSDWAQMGLARIALLQNKPHEARELLEPVRLRHPDAANVLYLLGNISRQLGEDEVAAERFRESAAAGGALAVSDPLLTAVQSLADGSRRHLDRGNTLFRGGRFEAAREAFAQAVAIDPRNPRALCNLGSALERLGNDVAARNAYEAAIEADPTFLTAHFNLGVLEARLGHDHKAVAHYNTVLTASPAHRDARFNRGNSLARVGAYVEAADEFALVVEQDPGNILARLAEARMHILAGDEATAAARLREAVQVAPDHFVARHELARLLVAAADESVRDPESGLTLARDIFAARSWVAHAETVAMGLAATGRFEEAIQMQQAALAAARAEGRSDLLEPMRENLHLYKSRHACRTPWRTEQLVPVSTARRTASTGRRR